jgi:salicylate hydroxylase
VATTRTIVVAGAGIGGLTTALLLAANGFRVVVLEKAEALAAVGAGLQLSPNATRVLVAAGLGEAIAARAVTPDAVSLMSARHGGEIARLPLGDRAAFRFGAPYWVMHRADLQTALREAVDDHPDIELRLGHQFEDAAPHANGITVGSRRGFSRESIHALALIGADGVWSAVRQRISPQMRPQFSGLVAWRGTIEARTLPRELAPRRVQVWMGTNAHLVMYPISKGTRINIVAITRSEWNRPGWDERGDAAELTALVATRWPASARMILGAVDTFSRYALFTLPDGGIWQQGPIALLGDAAHAMLPFAAQGAGMAIEDAATLAKCIGEFSDATTPAAVTQAVASYAGQRSARVARVQKFARQSGSIYHMSGAMALARDTTIRLLGGARLLSRNDWIYDWKA